jgi:hypothetical protein
LAGDFEPADSKASARRQWMETVIQFTSNQSLRLRIG